MSRATRRRQQHLQQPLLHSSGPAHHGSSTMTLTRPQKHASHEGTFASPPIEKPIQPTLANHCIQTKPAATLATTITASTTTDTKSTASTRLLTHEEIPPWYAQNAQVLTGYRPVTPSVRGCLASLSYLHNETINIYTHLLPCVTALLGNVWLSRYFAHHYPLAPTTDRAVYHIYLTTSVLCFGASSAYHTLLCHSAGHYDFWGRLDYGGILMQILGSFISGLYVEFYCESERGLRWGYWGMIGSLIIISGVLVIHPKFQGRTWRSLRLSAFVATALSAFVPILHAFVIFESEILDRYSAHKFYYLEGLMFLTGVFFYATHFPESWAPKRFDLCGASHQIFHVFVVLGALAHFAGILSAYETQYREPRCPAVA